MKLSTLIRVLPGAVYRGDLEAEVTAVSQDSRQIGPGTLFAAVIGTHDDGRRHVDQAVAAGAVAVLTTTPLESDPGVPVIVVPEIRPAMAMAAAEVYGRPADRMTMIGVTGTNGKTTTTYLLESILTRAGHNVGVVGTINGRYPGQSKPASNTTPEGPELQGLFRDMLASGVTHAIMEVSSHGLGLGRVAGCAFRVAAFTNLTQDHLDFHGHMESYFAAKKRLFTDHLNTTGPMDGYRAVINVDDPWGRRLVAELAGLKTMTYSLTGAADLAVIHGEATRSGLRARLATPAGELELSSPLLGDINLYNLLTAIGLALSLGLPLETIGAALAEASGAPGRLERVGTQDDYLVLVDYAHTPDALARALGVARGLKPDRLLTVFGCGGDRDRTKRPLMGAAAGELADLAIVTSDNPRTEDPLAIIAEIEPGLTGLGRHRISVGESGGPTDAGGYLVIPDRRTAIKLAVKIMAPGDILVIAGKGHEDYQVLGREKIHFDDREEARAALTKEGKA